MSLKEFQVIWQRYPEPSSRDGTGQQFCSPARLELTRNCLAVYAKLQHIFWPGPARCP